jgi:hypothetical protein
MSMPDPIEPPGSHKRMSTTVKLTLMGVGAVALLYSCTPAIGGFRSLPFLWGFGNPFYRPPMATTCPPGSPANCDQQASRSGGGGGGGGSGSTSSGNSSSSTGTAGQTTSSRGGFGSSAGAHGASGS